MDDIMQRLSNAGAVLLDYHFVYKSQKHGSGYINMDPIFPDVSLIASMAALMVRPFESEFDTVAGPATGGVVLAFAAASQTPGVRPAAVWADKDGDEFRFERAGFVDHLIGKRVLIVEDLLTTGGSVAKVAAEVERHGGFVIGVSTIVNRGGVTARQLGVPYLEALANVSFEAVDASECPLCDAGVPIVVDIGHGRAYKVAHPDYHGGYIELLF